MTILPTKRYEEAAYGSNKTLTKATLKRLDPVHHKAVGKFVIRRVENLLCEAGLPTLPEMQERASAKTAISILTNTEHSTRHLCTSIMYNHYITKPNTPKPMCIKAMEYLERYGIDARKIEPTLAFMRPP
jgi:hypothetical protein